MLRGLRTEGEGEGEGLRCLFSQRPLSLVLLALAAILMPSFPRARESILISPSLVIPAKAGIQCLCLM
jgi:hypothetical protein